MATVKKQGGFHYGWVVCIVCMLMMLAVIGCISNLMSINLAGIRNATGFTGTQTSLVVTLRSIFGLLATFFIDKYYEKLGLRLGMAVTSWICALAFVVWAFAGDTLMAYYVGASLGGIAYGFGLMLPAAMMLKRWFNKSRGTALGIVSAGSGIATIILPPILQKVMDTAGLRPAFWTQFGICVVAGLLMLLLLRNDPAEMGLEPVGGKDYVEEAKAKKGNSKTLHVDGAYLPNGYMWFLVIMMAVIGIASSPAVAHIVLHWQTSGVENMAAAAAFSVYGTMLTIGKFAYGWLMDKLGMERASKLACTFLAVGMLFCTLVGVTTGTTQIMVMYLAIPFLGFGFPINTVGYPLWCAEFCKDEDYNRMLKRCQIFFQLGTLAGSSLPGIMADTIGHGSYTPSFMLNTVIWFAYLVMLFIIFAKHNSIKKQILAEKQPVAEGAAA